MTGVLSDGTKIVVRVVPLSKHGTWPLYQALYKNGGASIGWVTISTSNTVDATVDWFRPPMPTSVYFPAGFTTNVTLLGEKYVKRSISPRVPQASTEWLLSAVAIWKAVS